MSHIRRRSSRGPEEKQGRKQSKSTAAEPRLRRIEELAGGARWRSLELHGDLRDAAGAAGGLRHDDAQGRAERAPVLEEREGGRGSGAAGGGGGGFGDGEVAGVEDLGFVRGG